MTGVESSPNEPLIFTVFGSGAEVVSSIFIEIINSKKIKIKYHSCLRCHVFTISCCPFGNPGNVVMAAFCVCDCTPAQCFFFFFF